MIICIDVDYREDPEGGPTRALAAGVVFDDWSAAEPVAEYLCPIPAVADYVPGEFYRRELPCILALLAQVDEPCEAIVIDGYVVLDAAGRKGLGAHLHEALGGHTPVIGVAKNPFRANTAAVEVLRGDSKRALYVTALGVDPEAAAEDLRRMHGPHRVPTLLARVDHLCRRGA